MTTLLLHSLAAVGLLIVATMLLRKAASRPPASAGPEKEFLHDPLNASGLALAERIFDPSDYLWLRSEIGFPYLAEDLWHTRRRLALDWLKAVRRYFDELVRTPEPLPAAHQSGAGPAETSAEDASSSWPLLWLTLRFHALMGYALFVVYTFGPYTRLVPSLRWMHTFSEIVAPSANSRMTHMRNAL